MSLLKVEAENDARRIWYGKNESQFGDLRLPSGNGPFPVVVLIHGGFWKSQFNLEQMNAFADALTATGIATWNIEYRRVGQEGGGWPGTYIDCAEAIDYLRILAESEPLDLNRVITVGHSAGGHLATWLASRKKLPKESNLYTQTVPLSITGIVSLAGVNDLALMYDIHKWKESLFGVVDNPTSDLMGGSPTDFNKRYAEGSPKELLPIGTPLVLIHGHLDVNVPIGLTESFGELAKKAGDIVTVEKIQHAEHFELIVPESSTWPTVQNAILNLLDNPDKG